MSPALNEGTKQPEKISVCFQIDAHLIQGKSPEEQEQAVQEGLIIRSYLSGELSIGEVGKALGLKYEATQEWLKDKGVPTLRELPLELKKITRKSLRKTAQDLGIKIPE